MQEAASGRDQIGNISTEQRRRKVIESSIPPSAAFKLKSGDRVYGVGETQIIRYQS